MKLKTAEVDQLIKGAEKYDWYWCIYKGQREDCHGRICHFQNWSYEAWNNFIKTDAELEFWKLFFFKLFDRGRLSGWNQQERRPQTILQVLVEYIPEVREAVGRKETARLLEKSADLKHARKKRVEPDMSPEEMILRASLEETIQVERTRARERQRGFLE